MKVKEALKIIGGSLSKPSKMPGWSIGLPAKECKTGGKLQKVPGSVCYDCYAMKGCYVFKVVQDAQYKRLASIRHELWTGAMALLINSKKSNLFIVTDKRAFISKHTTQFEIILSKFLFQMSNIQCTMIMYKYNTKCHF